MVVNSFVTPAEEETEEDAGHDYSTRITKAMHHRLEFINVQCLCSKLGGAAAGAEFILCRWLPDAGSEGRQQDHMCCHGCVSTH